MKKKELPSYEADEHSVFIPQMRKHDFENLKASLEQYGYMGDPILLRDREGDGVLTIIDGRNRYLACKELGIMPRFKTVKWGDTRVRSEVWRRNIVRRQANKSDIACAMLAYGGVTTKDVQAASGLSLSRVNQIKRKIKKDPELKKELLDRTAKGESTHTALNPGVKTEAKIKKAEESSTLHYPWTPKISPTNALNFAKFSVRAGYSTPQRALTAILKKLGNAALQDCDVDIIVRCPKVSL